MSNLAVKTSGDLSTPEQRLRALYDALAGSVEMVVRAAAILNTMIDAGDDISTLPSHIRKWLVRIHSRHVLPEVFVELGGPLRDAVALMPLSEQRKVLNGTTVQLLIRKADGVETLEMDPRNMTNTQVRQVFSSGTVRDLAEQRAYIEDRVSRILAPTRSEGVKLDRKRKGVVVGSVFYPVVEVAQWVARLSE